MRKPSVTRGRTPIPCQHSHIHTHTDAQRNTHAHTHMHTHTHRQTHKVFISSEPEGTHLSYQIMGSLRQEDLKFKPAWQSEFKILVSNLNGKK